VGFHLTPPPLIQSRPIGELLYWKERTGLNCTLGQERSVTSDLCVGGQDRNGLANAYHGSKGQHAEEGCRYEETLEEPAGGIKLLLWITNLNAEDSQGQCRDCIVSSCDAHLVVFIQTSNPGNQWGYAWYSTC
jgi:hypothetical protein